MYMIETYIGTGILCGIFASIIARSKGRNPFGWFLVGLGFNLFAFTVAALPQLTAEPKEATIKDMKDDMLTTVLKWVGTILTVGGALMTAIDVDPLNIYLFNAGALAWLIAAVRMKELSLIVVNGALLTIYIIGFILRIPT